MRVNFDKMEMQIRQSLEARKPVVGCHWFSGLTAFCGEIDES